MFSTEVGLGVGGEEWCWDKPNAKCKIYQRAARCRDFQFNFQITAVSCGELFGAARAGKGAGKAGWEKMVMESQSGFGWAELG